MAKLNKRTIDQAVPAEQSYFIWDEDLPGFGVRVFVSGRRSYVVQYSAKGRTRRFTIGPHGVWTPETARKEARVLLGHVAHGGNPSEEKQFDIKAITVKQLCERYLEGASVRPIGLPVVDLLTARATGVLVGPVFGGTMEGKPLIGFPKHWLKIVARTPLAKITPHVLRHSFASVANDLGFTESTVAALLGHAQGSVTSRTIHAVDSALVMAADTVAGYIQALLDGVEFKRAGYSLDREARVAAMARVLEMGGARPPGSAGVQTQNAGG